MEAIIPHQEKNIFYISLVLLALSIFDALMTLRGIDLGAIHELNPIMNQIMLTSKPLFLLIKIMLPLLFCGFCWQKRYPIRLKLVIAIYAVGVLLHLSWMLKTKSWYKFGSMDILAPYQIVLYSNCRRNSPQPA